MAKELISEIGGTIVSFSLVDVRTHVNLFGKRLNLFCNDMVKINALHVGLL